MDIDAGSLRRAEALALRRGSTIRTRGVRRVRRGVYCTDNRRLPSFEESVVAALLALPRGSVAAGLTAARLWRLDGLPASDRSLGSWFPGAAMAYDQPAASTLRFERSTGVDLPDGIPATSLPRTLVDLVSRSSFADGLVLVEAALRSDPSLITELELERARRTPRRGAVTVRRVLAVGSWSLTP